MPVKKRRFMMGNALVVNLIEQMEPLLSKIFENEDGSYGCVVGNRTEDGSGAILLFRSEDGFEWSFVSVLDRSRNEYGKMWECPDFFELDGKHVLLVSPQEMYAREEFHAGYGTVCFVGTFDEKHCAFERHMIQPVDYGLTFYAPQTTLAPDGRRILIAWMDNWETCKEAPRRHPWYAQMTAPRELFIRNNRLCQRPVREMENLWKDTIQHRQVTVQEEMSLPGVEGRLLDLELTLHAKDSACRRFTLHVAKDESHYIQIRCDLARSELIFDRSHGGSRRDIAHTRHVKAGLQDGSMTLRLLMDKESIELFINDGEQVVTSLIPTPISAAGITFAADAPVKMSVTAHHLG